MTSAFKRWQQRLAKLLDPEAAVRESHLRYRLFLLLDTLNEVAWRQAMNLQSSDQKAAYRLIHMRLKKDLLENQNEQK